MGFDFIVIAPLLPSHCGFSFVFGCGVSFLVSSSVFPSTTVQQLGDYGALARGSERTPFFSAILNQSSKAYFYLMCPHAPMAGPAETQSLVQHHPLPTSLLSPQLRSGFTPVSPQLLDSACLFPLKPPSLGDLPMSCNCHNGTLMEAGALVS